jgi:predicted enzyme related to lactoylglutathione lyase
MIRYAHTNIIAKDCKLLIRFYKEVFHCQSIGETRDLRAPWLEDLSGVPDAHIVGEHLLLPGHGESGPTLEIFQYDQVIENGLPIINGSGLAHLAFEVEDVEATLQALLNAGGNQLGKLIQATYPGKIGTMVYARDPEGNIIEIQNWQKII